LKQGNQMKTRLAFCQIEANQSCFRMGHLCTSLATLPRCR